MSADLGSIRARLEADPKAFISGLAQAGAQLKEFTSEVGSMAGKVAAAIIAANAAHLGRRAAVPVPAPPLTRGMRHHWPRQKMPP